MSSWPVPPGLGRLGGTSRGRDWLRSLPGLVAECAERWDLRLGEPYTGGYTSPVAPARVGEGSEAVLGVDRKRVRLWCLVQALAWGLGSDYLEQRVETARWLRDG
ncbi:MAG TPA: hypothetical protein VIA06_23650 [Candidatus Dormibacteraeota bacterium]|nr:hypothetical protein [Candidatus Dormibacteraeota bacterium]